MIRDTLLLVLLTQLYLIQNEEMYLHIHFKSVQLGGTVSLLCSFKDNKEFQVLFWYKQTNGQMPNLVASITDSGTIIPSTKFSDLRFQVNKAEDISSLIISNVSTSDEATYFCAFGTKYEMTYRNGTYLATNGDSQNNYNSIRVEKQPIFDRVLQGDSVTLRCTILSETCAGDHSVYWFRAGSRHSFPGVIYTQDNRCKQYENSPKTPSSKQSCVYSLSKNNVNLSDAGTYYCAVATCGEILFSNGTKLDIVQGMDPLFLVYCMGVGLGITFVLVIVLACFICSMNIRTCQHCREFDSQTRGPRVSRSDAGSHDIDTLHYAALNLSKKNNRSRRQRSNMEEETEVMYAGIRQ